MKKTLQTVLCITFAFMLSMMSVHAQKLLFKSAPADEISTTSIKTSLMYDANGSNRGSNSILLYSTAQTDAAPGVYITTLGEFQTATKVATLSQSYQAMEVVDGVIYVTSYAVGPPESNTFGTLDPNTGVYTLITPSNAPDAISMAYNPIDKNVYTTIWGSASGSPFGKINLASGAFTQLGTVPGLFYIAIDNDGICYAFDSGNNKFGTVNLANGAFTEIQTYSDNYNYIQDIVIDRETNELYHNARIDPDRVSKWNKIDKATGNMTPLGSFGKHVESVVIYEPTSPPECNPVTNLTVEYQNDCAEAKLTWNAPDKGSFSYIIFRDGDPIETVETETYTDTDFEPTLDHTWAVQVVCENSTSALAYLYKINCTTADCPQRPKNFSVKYTAECEAKLTWNAPTDILHDNTAPTSTGYPSSRWMLEEFSRNILADNFEVPTGETWHIAEAFIYGFYKTTTGDYDAPDYIGIEIFEDDGGLPGNQVYEEAYLMPVSGQVDGQTTIILPEPFILSEGKYWFSYYGTYDADYDDNRNFILCSHEEIMGDRFARLDEEIGFWEPFTGQNEALQSLFFRLQGHIGSNPIFYNIYRDNQLIKSNVEGIEYTDMGFDVAEPHKWSIKVACPDGGESAPALVNLPNCIAAVSEKEITSFTIAPNPAYDKIKITAENDFNAIEVINFLGQSVISQSNIALFEIILDVSHLNNGVYFVRIISDNGTSVQKFVKQ